MNSSSGKIKINQKLLFGVNLKPIENVLFYYFLPTILASVLFILIIAIDIGVIFRHYKDANPIWASLTLFFIYLPSMGSLIIIITDWDLWPDPENGMTMENFSWLFKKFLAHLLFPLWNLWRYAERIFWSIDAALNCDNAENYNNAIENMTIPRLIELYIFLQSYLHSLPQILLQLHVLMRHNSDIIQDTKITQAFSIILNLAKIAVTTTYYQRFKANKLTGSQYPWLKERKILRSQKLTKYPEDEASFSGNIIQNNNDDITRLYDLQPSLSILQENRNSEIYLEPEPFLDPVMETLEPDPVIRPKKTTDLSYINRISALLGSVNKTTSYPVPVSRTEADFRISRIRYIKGIEEDDLAGKILAFLWWFTFLFSRVLAISTFAYFFSKTCFWLLFLHVLLVIAVLLYDVKTDKIKRDKSVFFIFLGVIYIFCIIEFKIRFKRVKFIYCAYFGLMFLENFIMCLIWYCNEIESLENDYWFRYIFYIIAGSHLLTLSSMIFYYILSRPKSVKIRAES